MDSKAFYVHSKAIAQCSKPLDRLIHGSIAESQQGFATLEGVDQGTFLRFIDWLYKGYYKAAEPRSTIEVDKEYPSSECRY